MLVNGYEIKPCADLYEANLNGADLSGANLYGAHLSRADLSGAALYEADLSGADLYGADLNGAHLRGADLSRADLRGANLNGANLDGAYLGRANLCGADLGGASLSRTMGIIDGGQDSRGYRFLAIRQHDVPYRILAGCRWFTREEAREHWFNDYHASNAECRDRCDLLDVLAVRKGWL
jgi:hypothetical protein